MEQQQRLPPDPYQSPRIRPIQGTVLEDPLALDDAPPDDRHGGLLSLSDGSDSDLEDGTTGMPSHITTYWKPRQGGINIFTQELMNILGDLTGCWFFPDPANGRVGISGGNFNHALRKLKNLEGLEVSFSLT